MWILLSGLIIFFVMHSIKMVAPGWREEKIASYGVIRWRAVYGILSFIALVLIIVGYGQARSAPVWLWFPPVWVRHISSLFMLGSFFLLASFIVPATKVKEKVGHPMLLAVKVWAFSHLLCNGSLADVVLFGSFLVWSIANYALSRRRDRASGTTYPSAGIQRDIISVVVAMVSWFAMIFFLHKMLIGVSPLI